jgi:hypothetical protein
MALKPESIAAATRLIARTSKKAARRRRTAKHAVTRLRRRAERIDPEGAPVDFRGGYLT